MIDIGQKVRFVPGFKSADITGTGNNKKKSVEGTVVYMNRQHKTFTVNYDCGGLLAKETFHWSQIGQDVHVVRGGRYGR